jgi:hypothetical protein
MATFILLRVQYLNFTAKQSPASFVQSQGSAPQGTHARSDISTAHSQIHTVHCTLNTTHCTLHTVHNTLHTAHCSALHTAHCTLHTAHLFCNVAVQCAMHYGVLSPDSICVTSAGQIMTGLTVKPSLTMTRDWSVVGHQVAQPFILL